MHYDVSRTNWKAAKYILLIQDGGAQYITFFSPVDLFIITFKYIAKTCSLGLLYLGAPYDIIL